MIRDAAQEDVSIDSINTEYGVKFMAFRFGRRERHFNALYLHLGGLYLCPAFKALADSQSLRLDLQMCCSRPSIGVRVNTEDCAGIDMDKAANKMRTKLRLAWLPAKPKNSIPVARCGKCGHLLDVVVPRCTECGTHESMRGVSSCDASPAWTVLIVALSAVGIGGVMLDIIYAIAAGGIFGAADWIASKFRFHEGFHYVVQMIAIPLLACAVALRKSFIRKSVQFQWLVVIAAVALLSLGQLSFILLL